MKEASFATAIVLDNPLISKTNDSLFEFICLLDTAGIIPIASFKQKVEKPATATYFGTGKLMEIAFAIAQARESGEQIDFIVCNFDLTAVQQKNIEQVCNINVLDRTYIILRIFELNAKTKEARLQVDIAKMEYLKNRLINNQASYSQVTSGSGHNKGEGEKKIELNRRKIADIIAFKTKELEEIKNSRRTMRNSRLASSCPKIAIVGYTNVGKSTLLNRLLDHAKKDTNKAVLAENKLFATLQTSTRLINTYKLPNFLVTDTVGFVSNIPTCLVKSFRSTLEEIKEADLLVHVVDISNENYEYQIKATNSVLEEIGVKDIPTVFILNKYDLLKEGPTSLPKENEFYSSMKDDNIDDVIRFIVDSFSKNWERKDVVFPYEKDFNSFSSDNYVESCVQKENGYHCTVRLNPKTLFKYSFLF